MNSDHASLHVEKIALIEALHEKDWNIIAGVCVRFVGDPTSKVEGPACQVRSEGRACRVHEIPFGSPSQFRGHDKRAPPVASTSGHRSTNTMQMLFAPFD